MKRKVIELLGLYLFVDGGAAAGSGAAGGAPAAGTSAGGAGSGGQQPWYSSLPEDLRGNAQITSLKSVDDLAKGYVNAQQLIGAKRIAVPAAGAKPEVMNEFYDSIGRPKTPAEYSQPTVALKEGITLDKAGIDKARSTFHGLGLTDAQQRGVLDFYHSGLNETHEASAKSIETARAAAENTLRTEWKDKYDANLDIARGALRRFGTPEAMADIEAGLGNNPALVKMFHKIGTSIMEDSSRAGGGNPLNVGDAAQALQKISELKRDNEFQKALNEKQHPGHQDAVALWTETHRLAYPKQSSEQ